MSLTSLTLLFLLPFPFSASKMKRFLCQSGSRQEHKFHVRHFKRRGRILGVGYCSVGGVGGVNGHVVVTSYGKSRKRLLPTSGLEEQKRRGVFPGSKEQPARAHVRP